jgi:hypothetical protein
MPYADAEARRRTVLVAVLNNHADLCRARQEGWYRIPQRRAPRRIGADYLAFYQTGAFAGEPEAHSVTYFAPTRRYQLLTRGELLPDQADHVRANDFYFRIDIGPLNRLTRPVPSVTLRRLTFIHTTLDRLLTAHDVRDLFYQGDPFERLWQALRKSQLRPLPNRIVHDQAVDITLRARGGHLGIQCRDEEYAAEAKPITSPDRWQMIHVAPAAIEQDLDSCLRRVAHALLSLGGSDLRK